MTDSRKKSGFIPVSPIVFLSKASKKNIKIAPEKAIEAVVNSNLYLFSMKSMFSELGFDIYAALGQRNLSGFIGEVFVRSFQKTIEGYPRNPHADGRPDLLDLTSDDARQHYQSKCFIYNKDKSKSPNRSALAPFKYGGLEVKSSIGSSVSKKERKKDPDSVEFAVGVPRIEHLQSITYWGHHASCENLIGLYYDYLTEADSAPQVLAVMHSELDPALDWNEVSIGKAGSKKTSNTSLTAAGKKKIYQNVVAVANKKIYMDKLRDIGLKF